MTEILPSSLLVSTVNAPPSGTLELLPHEQKAFQDMLETIRRVYELYGFVPLETPVFEMTQVLLNKDSIDHQIYYVQSSGALSQGHSPELALRFDLTVPLARYVARHERRLAFPFRRHQIQRVYRGERPQKGRFREFYQCDIDAVGKNDLPLYHDAEILAVIQQVFETLDLGRFTIHFNHRALLYGLADFFGLTAAAAEILNLLDKLYKTGPESAFQAFCEVVHRVAPPTSATALRDMFRLFTLKAAPEQALSVLSGVDHPAVERGTREIRAVLDELKPWGTKTTDSMVLDVSIVRGLDYYTGMIYETFLNDHPDLGSVCSGGRYDNLTRAYTASHLPGVGVSIGLTRLFSFLRDNALLPVSSGLVKVLVVRMDAELRHEYVALAQALRFSGIPTAVYSQDVKLSKQIHYANRAGIPFVILLGSQEKSMEKVTVKTLADGAQQTLSVDEAIRLIQQKKPGLS